MSPSAQASHPSAFIRSITLAGTLALCSIGFAAESSSHGKVANSRDLQGLWTAAIFTPLERPAELEGKTHFSPGELEEQQRKSTQRFWEAGHRAGDVGRDNDAFLDDNLKLLADGQTSLIVDPSDGKVPLRPEAELA